MRCSVSTAGAGGSNVATLLEVLGNCNLMRGGFNAQMLFTASARAKILGAIGRQENLPGCADGLTRRGGLASVNSVFAQALMS